MTGRPGEQCDWPAYGLLRGPGCGWWRACPPCGSCFGLIVVCTVRISVPSMNARARSDTGEVAASGPVAQGAECLCHVQAEALGELALGLLDEDPAVQGDLQLLVQGVAVAQVALVQQADRGYVG